MEAPKGITLTVDCATAWPARLRSPKAVRELIWTIVEDGQRDNTVGARDKIAGVGRVGEEVVIGIGGSVFSPSWPERP
jgi:hypothetical protein